MQSMNYRLDIRNESSTHDVWERVLRTKRTVRVQHAEWMDCTIAMATHTGAYVYIIIDDAVLCYAFFVNPVLLFLCGGMKRSRLPVTREHLYAHTRQCTANKEPLSILTCRSLFCFFFVFCFFFNSLFPNAPSWVVFSFESSTSTIRVL